MSTYNQGDLSHLLSGMNHQVVYGHQEWIVWFNEEYTSFW